MALLFRSLLRISVLAASGYLYAASTVAAPNAMEVHEPMLLLTEADNGRTLSLRLGEAVRLVLPENATTGYRWAIDHYDRDLIEVTPMESHYPGTALGSGGEVELVFKGKGVGSGEILLKQWRHWEGDASIIQRFVLRLTVGP